MSLKTPNNSKQLVNKVTGDDRTPPAGYVLQELAKKTSSIDECQIIEDLILAKLEKNKPNVKAKALKVIKYLAENGNSHWRLAWQRHTDKIKACQQYRGPPDPIYGDTPYETVRNLAKEAMQAIFSSTQPDTSRFSQRINSINGANPNKEPSKFGNSVTNIPSHKAPTPGKRMQGFGNTPYIPQVKPQVFQPIQASDIAKPVFDSNRHANGPLPNKTSRDGRRKRGQIGGDWIDNQITNSNRDENEQDDDNDEYQNDTNNKSTNKYNVSNVHSDGVFERKWVEQITDSGGVGGKISENDLVKYTQYFETLSKLHILESLDEKLDKGSWQQQAKALTLIESLLNGASAQIIGDYFCESPEALQALLNSSKSALKKKAQLICRKIGIDDDTNSNNIDDSNNHNNDILYANNDNKQNNEEELFIFDTNTQNPTVEDTTGLFDNLNIKAVDESISNFSFQQPSQLPQFSQQQQEIDFFPNLQNSTNNANLLKSSNNNKVSNQVQGPAFDFLEPSKVANYNSGLSGFDFGKPNGHSNVTAQQNPGFPFIQPSNQPMQIPVNIDPYSTIRPAMFGPIPTAPSPNIGYVSNPYIINNDPFFGMHSSSSTLPSQSVSVQPIPKIPVKDPFADFALGKI